MKAGSASQDHEDLKVELYKCLRTEASGYLDKIPALWLQKFVLIGLMLAFLLTRQSDLNFIGKTGGAESSFDIALVAVAILACFLDAKILEYALHARAISAFIEQEFADTGALPRWERTLWGYSSDKFIRRTVRIRSVTTVFVTALPTVLVIILVSIVIYIRREAMIVLIIGLLISFAYIICALAIWPRLWPNEARLRTTGTTEVSPDRALWPVTSVAAGYWRVLIAQVPRIGTV
jgi:hypothetical protein